MIKTPPHTDIQPTGWIAKLPARFQAYAILARLDRPIGIWLLLLPSLWSLVLASGTQNFINAGQLLWLCFLFTCGAIVMRSAGCVINDLWDRKFDAQVSRTKTRPLASGQLTPVQALKFLALLLSAGLWILLSLNHMTMFLGLLVLPLILLYPLMKRVTHWPQAVLGLTFNFGALMGWSAVTHTLEWQALLLYSAGVLWTLGYDTIYAHQDAEDDALLGLKSTALRFGQNTKFWLAGFYGGVWVCLTLALFSSSHTSAVWGGLGSCAMAAHLIWQITAFELNTPQKALRIFKSNRDFGLIVLAALILCVL